MSLPVVLLPFEPTDLGEPPEGLDYRVAGLDWLRGGESPEDLDRVELWVPPYNLGRIGAETLAPMTSLRVVQTLSAGVDHLRGVIPDGVMLCNGRGIHDTSTAELAVTLMLASLRDIPGFVREQDRGKWDQSWRPALADKTVLIIGYGAIGSAIEQRLVPFEVDIVRVARRAREDVHAIEELPELLPTADVVVLVVPSTPQTQHLVDADFLAAMKPGALLVNVARGSVVDTEALIEAATDGRVRAALDVTDPEPLPSDHRLWRTPGVLITTHVGGASSAMWPRAHRLVREQLRRYAAGEPLVNQLHGDY